MPKNIFVVDEEHRTSNSIAAVSFTLTFWLFSYLQPYNDVYSFIVTAAIAYAPASIAYIVSEFIRKKRAN